MTEPTRRAGRVVVAVDAADASDLALELARHLSESVSPELLGLFVENVRLLDYTRSRLAREITRSGLERPLRRAELERQIRSESTQARLRFEQTATRLGVRFSFRVTRGEVASELLEQAAEAEALVLSLAARSAGPEPWLRAAVERLIAAGLPVLLFAREDWVRGRSIGVVVDDAERLRPSLHAAARLAKASKSPLTIMLTGAALADRHASARRVMEGAAAHGAEIGDVVAIAAVTAPALERAVRFCRARLLVLPDGDAELIVDLLRRLPSALMLVRG